jgi:hypothetical protein
MSIQEQTNKESECKNREHEQKKKLTISNCGRPKRGRVAAVGDSEQKRVPFEGAGDGRRETQ